MKIIINRTDNSIDSHKPINNKLPNITSYKHPHLEVKITQDSNELKKAMQLRQKFYSRIIKECEFSDDESCFNSHPRKKIERQKAVVYDGYDSFAENLIILNNKTNEIIAYVRLIDSYTAYKIGGYYSETRFNLNTLLEYNTFYMEVSRIVVDPDYNSREIAELIWFGIINHAAKKGCDALFGLLSLPVIEQKSSSALLKQLKKKYHSTDKFRVSPYQLHPEKIVSSDDIAADPVADYFFEKGSKLCSDAYWNRDFNCSELFFYYPFTQPLLAQIKGTHKTINPGIMDIN